MEPTRPEENPMLHTAFLVALVRQLGGHAIITHPNLATVGEDIDAGRVGLWIDMDEDGTHIRVVEKP
jgi:hypothetical protein